MSAAPAIVLEPQWLLEHAGDPQPRIVDLCKSENYPSRHIAGAVHLPYDRLVRKQAPAGGLLPAADVFQTLMRELGVDDGQHVIGYDEEGGGRAARLVWTLHAYGHRQASLLNGGIEAWTAAGLPLAAAPVQPPAGSFRARPDATVVADFDYIAGILGDPGHTLLDARSLAEYTGERKVSERGGHIPGARHLEWTELMDPARQRRLCPDDQIRALLQARGVDPAHEVVVYCQTHHRSALNYVALKALGYPRVRGYAGSWSEWGNRPDAPVDTGPPAD